MYELNIICTGRPIKLWTIKTTFRYCFFAFIVVIGEIVFPVALNQLTGEKTVCVNCLIYIKIL